MKNKNVKINDIEYELLRNDRDCFDIDIVSEKITDYFDDYDYILGDYAYDKLRLKGFCDSNNKNANMINDIKTVDDYIRDYCSYGAKVFLLKKIQKKKK